MAGTTTDPGISSKSSKDLKASVNEQSDGIYAPLNPDEDEIRLLEVILEKDAKPKYELRSPISLRHSRPRYIALSYPWGASSSTRHSINISGHDRMISQNLSEALPALVSYWQNKYASHNRQFLVWCDQICIQQDNETEKNHQVAFMKRIFGNAEEVVVWLPVDRKARGYDDSWQRSFLKMAEYTVQRAKEYPEAFAQDEAWHVIAAVLQNSWWSRAWVYQEFMLAAQATFLIADSAVLWTSLRWFLRSVMDIPENRKELDAAAEAKYLQLFNHIGENPIPSQPLLRRIFHRDHYHRVRNEHRFGKWSSFGDLLRDRKSAISSWPMVNYLLEEKSTHTQKGSKYPTLARLLLHTRKCNSQDPRDKVFAVLGLADPSCSIKPDYSPANSLLEVCISTTIECIRESESLNFVMTAFEDKDLGLISGTFLPGWVPDLSTTVEAKSSYAQFLGNLGLPDGCQASKASKAEATFCDNPRGERNRVLKARGRRIGILSSFIDENMPHEDASRGQLAVFANLQDIEPPIHFVTRSNAKRGDEV